MSVLSFPRIYFNGYMGWDPPTANNNDYLPTYSGQDALLDWDFLVEQDPSITRDNFREKFRPWVIRPHDDSCPNPKAGSSDTCMNKKSSHMASRWNYYGGGGCWFVDYEVGGKITRTTGGDTGFHNPASSADAILQKPVVLEGNIFGDKPSPARLVDVNPQSPWSSQIFLVRFGVGDDTTYLRGHHNQRMHARAFFAPRNLSQDLIIAGTIGVVFQASIPFAALEIKNEKSSNLLVELVRTMQEPDAEGLMVRFTAYTTLYYQNGIFNNLPQQPRTCDQLMELYERGEVFKNPAYSEVAGVLGVWKKGELATVPGGRHIVPYRKVIPVAAPEPDESMHKGEFMGVSGGHASLLFADPPIAAESVSGPPALAFGSIWAEFETNKSLVSLDLSNAIPERKLDGTKFDYGPIRIGLCHETDPDGTFNCIGSFDFSDYDRDAYLKKSGIVDVQFQDATPVEVKQWLQDGQIVALQVKQGGSWQTVSLECALTTEIDNRGIYLDENGVAQFTVQVRYKNGTPPTGTKIRLVQYYPYPLNIGSGSWVRFGASPPKSNSDNPTCTETPSKPYLRFPDGDTIDVVKKGGWGEATVRLESACPGFPLVAFYPYLPKQEVVIQDRVQFSFDDKHPEYYMIGNAYYTAVRVLPFDDQLVQRFVDCWNTSYSRELAWEFIYDNILYVYDMLYPVMEQFVPLSDLERVEGAIDQLVTTVSADWADTSTLYMPVTRELSAGKR